MKQCLYRYLAVSFAVVAMLVRADEPSTNSVSIDALVRDALANNPELNFYRAEIASAKGERRSAGTIANPDAEFELGHKRVRESGSLSGEGVAWSVGLAQTFEYPNRLALRKAIANRQVELAEIGFAHFQQALASRVRLLGYKLLVAQEKENAAAHVSKRGQELIEVLVQRDPAGTTPLLESRIIEANVLSLRRRANQATKEAQTALLELNQLRGKPVSSSLTIAPTKIKFPPVADAEEIFTVARTNNFELKSRGVEFEQQGLKVALSKNERYPAFTVKPFYSEENAGENERVAGVGLSLPLPLWNRNAGNIETAKARQQQADISLLLTQRRIERELRENLSSYEIQQKEISTWRPNVVEQLQDAAELADRHYRLGSLPVSTYVEMQEKYLEGLDAILDTQADALENLQQLELLTGKFALSITELRREEAK